MGLIGIAFGAIPMFSRGSEAMSVRVALAYPLMGDRWYVWAAVTMTIAVLIVVGPDSSDVDCALKRTQLRQHRRNAALAARRG